MEVRTVKNVSGVPAVAEMHGLTHELQPGESKIVTLALAEAFQKQCPDQVQTAGQARIGGVAEESGPPKTIWLANMTGNPEVPDRVTVKSGYDRQRSKWFSDEIDHPHKKPRVIYRVMNGGQVIYTDPEDGKDTGMNLGPKVVEIPPYSRKEFDINTARWMLNRDARSGWPTAGAIIKSKAPHPDEPDESWELDKLVCYLSMLDRSAKLPPRVPQITKEVKRQLRSMPNPEKRERAIEQTIEQRILDAKSDALKKIFFRVAKPDSRVVTRAEFEDYYRDNFEVSMEALDAMEAQRLLDQNLQVSA